MLPFEEWTKRRAGAPLGPGAAERLDILPLVLQRHRFVEVRGTVADAAERMEGIGVAGMQDAQAMAKVNGVGEIRDDAPAAPASGIYESLVDRAFKEGLDTGGDHDDAGPVFLRTQLGDVGVDFPQLVRTVVVRAHWVDISHTSPDVLRGDTSLRVGQESREARNAHRDPATVTINSASAWPINCSSRMWRPRSDA